MYVICNTPMAVGITRRTLFGFRQVDQKANIKNVQLIERASKNQEELVQELKSVGFWKGNTSKQEMKFNAVVGNPPYQLSGHGQKPLPIYQNFIDLARTLKPKCISIVSPSRWFAANDLKEFRDSIIKENKLDIIHDFADARLCFPNVEIKGGISYFRWNDDSNQYCNFFIHNDKGVTQTMRNLSTENTEILIRDGYMIKILEKVQSKNEAKFNSLISSNDPFGFDMREEHSSKRVKVPYYNTPKENSAIFYYNGWRKKGVGYVDREIINKNTEWVDKVKILIPKAWGTGDTTKDWLKPFIVEKNTCCTETYLVVGPFDSLEIAENVVSYMGTKFFHFMVAIMKLTQNAMQGVYCNVPIQDFSHRWTDEDLYEKYGLDFFEREYIESLIKPMD